MSALPWDHPEAKPNAGTVDWVLDLCPHHHPLNCPLSGISSLTFLGIFQLLSVHPQASDLLHLGK